MSKEDCVELEGVIVEVMPGTRFKVKLSNGHIIQTYISGKLRKNNIKIFEGDFVKVELSGYDLSQGRITWRGKQSMPSQANTENESL